MRVRCVSRSDKDFQFMGIFVRIAHRASRIELRFCGRDSFVDFFYFASPSAHFLLRDLAVAYVSWSGVGVVDSAVQSTAQER